MNFDPTHWRTEKILTPVKASVLAAGLRQNGKRIVTTNGAFDIFHWGHLDQLEEARKQGDVLFVGINSDEAVANAKGKGRPIIPEQARAAMLAAQVCVDYVVIMEGDYREEPMKSLLKTVHPEVHVNGQEYRDPSMWIEWPMMQRLGIAGHVATMRNSISTSGLIAQIRNIDQPGIK